MLTCEDFPRVLDIWCWWAELGTKLNTKICVRGATRKSKEGNKFHLVEYLAENEKREEVSDARLGSAAQMVHHMFARK